MTNKIDAIKEKLRKILAIARSNGNEFERDMAMTRLQEMLIKHRLEMTDIEEKEKEGIVRIAIVGKNGPWARKIAASIARLNFCNYYFQRMGSNDHRFVHHVFVGRPLEAETAKELAMLIIDQLSTEAGTQGRKSGDPSFERSFLNAASQTISNRVYVLMEEAGKPSTTQTASTALMVVNAYEQAKAENEQFLAVTGIAIKTKAVRTATKSYAGAIQGRQFGEKIPLSITKKLA